MANGQRQSQGTELIILEITKQAYPTKHNFLTDLQIYRKLNCSTN